MEKNEKKKQKKTSPPDVGVEPTTVGLKVQRSTTELTGLLESILVQIETNLYFQLISK